MTGQKAGRGTSNYETGGEHFDKESLLCDREEDYGERADAPFRGLPAAEGICVYQFVEQPIAWHLLRPRIH